jgi:hypothetical protein
MSPLSDDELSSLLKEAKNTMPQPAPEQTLRALRTYQANVARSSNWRGTLLRPVSFPLPIGVFAALLLVLIGAVCDRSLRRPSAIVQIRRVEVPVPREAIVYRDCPAAPQLSSPPVANLTFKEFQPVRQIRPRVIRSAQNE